ncbi:MAG: methyltransferase [Brevefilum sp.]
MTKLDEQLWFREARSLPYFFYRQIWHVVALLILVPITWAFAAPALSQGSFLGIKDTTWFWLSMVVPICHQVIVWIVFRLQMGWATLSKLFGRADLIVWGVIFLPFVIARPVLLAGLARATQSTLALPGFLSLSLGVLLILPALYTIWSVFRYFGLVRAMVGDHFRIRFRKMPLVKKGAFKFSQNAMYAFAFFLLWSIALVHQSQAALSIALFQHAYIWVHYYCTEKPDMDIIYSKENLDQ